MALLHCQSTKRIVCRCCSCSRYWKSEINQRIVSLTRASDQVKSDTAHIGHKAMANTTMASGINEGRLLAFLIVLYASTIAASIGRRILGARLAAWRSDGLGATCMSFAALTLAMQAMLACVLEEKPAAAAAAVARRPASGGRLPWLVAAVSWMCVTNYFVAYIALGGNVAPTSLEWTAAGVASAANLAIATRTVRRHLGVSNPAKNES
ncbi:uncharacterized protein [Oryza sativa Japonica Group]